MLNSLVRRAPQWTAHVSLLSFMSHPSFTTAASMPDHEQKQAALGYLNEAWAEARTMASTATASRKPACSRRSHELVGTLRRDAVAKFVEGLPVRVRNGEFSITLANSSSVVIAGLTGDLVFQSSSVLASTPRRTGSPGQAGDDTVCVAALCARRQPELLLQRLQNRTGSPVDGVSNSPCHITRPPARRCDGPASPHAVISVSPRARPPFVVLVCGA